MARWHRATRLDCRKCIEVRQEAGWERPDCSNCDRPQLLPSNDAAWQVLMIAGSTLVDGMGGVRLDNARQAAEALGYPWDEDMLTKVSAYAGFLLEPDDGAVEEEDDGD